MHAIWPGSVLLETQQNCDLTYRMYDYGRGRELHIEKSLEAVQLKTKAGKVAPRILEDRTILVESQYFCVERIPVEVSRPSASLCREDEPKGYGLLVCGRGKRAVGESQFCNRRSSGARNRCGSGGVAGLCNSGYRRAGFDSHYAALARFDRMMTERRTNEAWHAVCCGVDGCPGVFQGSIDPKIVRNFRGEITFHIPSARSGKLL